MSKTANPIEVRYEVVSRPTLENKGLTKVTLHQLLSKDVRTTLEGTTPVVMGEITKERGSPVIMAYVYAEDGDDSNKTLVEGDSPFETRSKAGHAIQRAFYASEREEKAATKVQAKIDRETEMAEKKAAREVVKAQKATDKVEAAKVAAAAKQVKADEKAAATQAKAAQAKAEAAKTETAPETSGE